MAYREGGGATITNLHCAFLRLSDRPFHELVDHPVGEDEALFDLGHRLLGKGDWEGMKFRSRGDL
jgi:hypothetical protein